MMMKLIVFLIDNVHDGSTYFDNEMGVKHFVYDKKDYKGSRDTEEQDAMNQSRNLT